MLRMHSHIWSLLCLNNRYLFAFRLYTWRQIDAVMNFLQNLRKSPIYKMDCGWLKFWVCVKNFLANYLDLKNINSQAYFWSMSMLMWLSWNQHWVCQITLSESVKNVCRAAGYTNITISKNYFCDLRCWLAKKEFKLRIADWYKIRKNKMELFSWSCQWTSVACRHLWIHIGWVIVHPAKRQHQQEFPKYLQTHRRSHPHIHTTKTIFTSRTMM